MELFSLKAFQILILLTFLSGCFNSGALSLEAIRFIVVKNCLFINKLNLKQLGVTSWQIANQQNFSLAYHINSACCVTSCMKEKKPNKRMQDIRKWDVIKDLSLKSLQLENSAESQSPLVITMWKTLYYFIVRWFGPTSTITWVGMLYNLKTSYTIRNSQ